MSLRYLVLPAMLVLLLVAHGTGDFHRLPVAVYRDKMAGAWMGQMIGVAYGAPTEFCWLGRIGPAAQCPAVTPGMLNGAFWEDDLYVEATFVRTLDTHGLDVSARQAGIDFANTTYPLWHANEAARMNLRRGIAPPDSGHPRVNGHAEDIDFQIEADFTGIVAPGLPNTAIALGDRFGHLMNYGDGVYAGQFVGGMYAAAFVESDIPTVVRAGLACIPAESQYAAMVRDVLAWHRAHPTDWERTWRLIEDKYHRDPAYSHGLCSWAGGEDWGSIDAKLNGAYVLLGLLYGNRDPLRTMEIACRAGQDSDCNPSTAMGVLGAVLGRSRLPAAMTRDLYADMAFMGTSYTVADLCAASERIARAAVLQAGGRIEGAGAAETLAIPVRAPVPGPLERAWVPGPRAESVYTQAEWVMVRDSTAYGMRRVCPGWSLANCRVAPGFLRGYAGRHDVLVTAPARRGAPCALSRMVAVPQWGRSELLVVAASAPGEAWQLAARLNGRVARSETITGHTWRTVRIDLTPYAGQMVAIALEHGATVGGRADAAYWGEIALR